MTAIERIHSGELSRTWMIGHVWISAREWQYAVARGIGAEVIDNACRRLMMHAPGYGPGPWLEWRAVPHPSGRIAIVLEFAGRAW